MPDHSDPRIKRPDGEARTLQVSVNAAALRKTPGHDAECGSVLLLGEIVDAFDTSSAFTRVRARRDRYVGWAETAALDQVILSASHKVAALRTFAYSAPDLKSPPLGLLSHGARLTPQEQTGDWVLCARAGWIHFRHLLPIPAYETDPARIALRFLGSPYLWSGRESLGLDCSGLMQQAFEACGILLPRDSDMQQAWCGRVVSDWQSPGGLQRNDLVFWDGHVGIMIDGTRLLHANAYHMVVAAEPLRDAMQRIMPVNGPVTAVKRLDLEYEAGRLPDWYLGAKRAPS